MMAYWGYYKFATGPITAPASDCLRWFWREIADAGHLIECRRFRGKTDTDLGPVSRTEA